MCENSKNKSAVTKESAILFFEKKCRTANLKIHYKPVDTNKRNGKNKC